MSSHFRTFDNAVIFITHLHDQHVTIFMYIAYSYQQFYTLSTYLLLSYAYLYCWFQFHVAM